MPEEPPRPLPLNFKVNETRFLVYWEEIPRPVRLPIIRVLLLDLDEIQPPVHNGAMRRVTVL